MKVKVFFKITNSDSWPRINSNAGYIGNDIEWYKVEDADGEDVTDDLIAEQEEQINKLAKSIKSNGLGYFKPDEEFDQFMEI